MFSVKARAPRSRCRKLLKIYLQDYQAICNSFSQCFTNNLQVELRADSIRLPLIRMAREGHRLIHASSAEEIEFACSADSDVGPVADVAFVTSESYVVRTADCYRAAII